MVKSRYLNASLTDHWLGVTAFTQPTVQALGLSSSRPDVSDDSNITEPSGNSYARVNTNGSWNAVGSDRVTTNSAQIQLAESSGAWDSGNLLRFFCLWDATTSGNLLEYGEVGKQANKYFQPADVATGTNRITITSHGYSDSDQVVVRAPGGTTLATGLTDDTVYYVSSIDANTIELYTDSALTSIVNLTAQGTGTHVIYKIAAPSVGATPTTITFASGQLTLEAGENNF